LLALTLAGYGAVTISLSRQTGRDATAARSSGVATGLAIGGSWLVLLIGLAPSPNWSFLPLAIAVLAPSAVAAVVAFRARSVAAGSLAALWAGLVGGLTIFVVYSFTTLLHQGRPYDAVLIDEFHRSGAANLVTYAVGDGLMQALAMLLIVPVIALALGSICARAAGRQAA
jgi:hypothetical protein